MFESSFKRSFLYFSQVFLYPEADLNVRPAISRVQNNQDIKNFLYSEADIWDPSDGPTFCSVPRPY